MPVLSPHRSSSSGLTGSYRSTFSSSTLDRPFYGTSSYTPRFSYSERYTTRSYADSDGRRIFSRTSSITEDGITNRFREDSRESSIRRDSQSRDSGIGSIRENSILESRRDSSLSRSEGGRSTESRLSSIGVAESVADLRNKYSPSNYVPAILRNKENISRSKTLNDIGLPPIEAKSTQSSKKKVTEPNLNNTTANARDFSNNTNCLETDNMHSQEDDNGNRPSVSEMRKKFDVAKNPRGARAPSLGVEGASVRILENKFKKLDATDREVKGVEVRKAKTRASDCGGDATKANGHVLNGRVALTRDLKKSVDRKTDRKIDSDNSLINAVDKRSKSKVSDDGIELRGGKLDVRIIQERDSDKTSPTTVDVVTSKPPKAPSQEKETRPANSTSAANNHVTNFASYIPSKDFEKGDSPIVENIDNGEMEIISTANKIKKTNKDITTSPRLNRSPIPQNSSSTTSSVSQRNSSERDGHTYSRRELDYDRTSPGKQLGLNGLKNIGNTCFMNSVIQCLSNTKPLLEYVKKEGHVNDINTTISSMKGALIKAFAQVIKELWSEDSSDRVVNTASLKSQIQRFAPRFMGYSQQDAQEFLRYLLEGLHEDVNRVSAKPTPIHTEIDEKLSDAEKAAESWQRYVRRENSKVVDLFVGQLKSTLKCTHCGHCSVTFDPFWDLSLPIPQKTGPVRLSQCLESFTREETLDGDEKPTCSKCKERRKCTKSFTIHKFPKILVIHLKRFSPTERFRGKLSITVDFPLEGLDMSNYAAESHTQCRYNLYAISNHSGTTYSGHYTAYCRHPYSHSWHEYNDSRVSSISAKSVVSGEAYVLFYELDSKLAHL